MTPGPVMTVDAAQRQVVIDGVIARLDEAYVFPDTARAMERAIRAREGRHEYDALTIARAFAESLTAHLQAVSRDRHLRVRYSAEPLPESRPDQGPGPEEEARARAFGKRVNYGIERAERLTGNVGYLELRRFRFEPAWLARELDPARFVQTGATTVPVVYKLSMRDARAYFYARQFPMQNKDILYVSNAPLTEVEKILRMIGQVTGLATSGTTLRNRLN